MILLNAQIHVVKNREHFQKKEDFLMHFRGFSLPWKLYSIINSIYIFLFIYKPEEGSVSDVVVNKLEDQLLNVFFVSNF